jgi:hypothetical protein
MEAPVQGCRLDYLRAGQDGRGWIVGIKPGFAGDEKKRKNEQRKGPGQTSLCHDISSYLLTMN